MCKLKHLRVIAVALVFGTLALFSCADKNPTASSLDNQSGDGSVFVTLPDLSSSLQKVSTMIDTNSLTLLIFAPGIDTIKYSWPVTSLQGQKVQIDGIPSGENRFFAGYLTNKSGILTHTGKVAVTIIAGTTVPVYLKLSGIGSADLCIDIEGYPSSCNTTPQDTLTLNNCLIVTSPYGYTNGNVSMTYYYGDSTASGSFNLISKSDSAYYKFVTISKIADTQNTLHCKSIVRNIETNTYHFLDLSVNLTTMKVTSGYLTISTNDSSAIIANFYAGDCNGNTTPQDTLIVNNCIYTSTSGTAGTGHISMMYTGDTSISGELKIVTANDTTLYSFHDITQITNSGVVIYCKAIVLNRSTLTYQNLYMHIITNTMSVSTGYLYSTANDTSSIITKFYAVDCDSTASIPVPITIPLNITTVYPDSLSINATLTIVTSGGSASGDFTLLNDWSGAGFTNLKVSGTVTSTDSTYNLSLMSSDSNGCTYSIILRNTTADNDFTGFTGGIHCTGGPCTARFLGYINSTLVD